MNNVLGGLIMRLISGLVVLAVIGVSSVSCSLYFREHFFLPGEAIAMDELTGTWDLYEPESTSGHVSDEQVKLIFTSPSAGTIECVMKRIQGKGSNIDNVPFLGKAYCNAGKKFLVSWDINEQGVDGKRVKKTNESCNIFHYSVNGDILMLYGLNKKIFEKLVSDKKLEGFGSGGGGYDRNTFHITSAGSKVRSVVLSAGIDSLIELDKPTEFHRNRAE